MWGIAPSEVRRMTLGELYSVAWAKQMQATAGQGVTDYAELADILKEAKTRESKTNTIHSDNSG